MADESNRAEVRIVEAEQPIIRQKRLIAGYGLAGMPTQEATKLLGLMLMSLYRLRQTLSSDERGN